MCFCKMWTLSTEGAEHYVYTLPLSDISCCFPYYVLVEYLHFIYIHSDFTLPLLKF